MKPRSLRIAGLVLFSLVAVTSISSPTVLASGNGESITQNARSLGRATTKSRRTLRLAGSRTTLPLTYPPGCSSNGPSSFVGEPGGLYSLNYAGGGTNNTYGYAGVAAGSGNGACDAFTFVGAGATNIIGGDGSTSDSAIVAGSGSVIETATSSVVVAGVQNVISGAPPYNRATASAILGGTQNAIDSPISFIGAGQYNSIAAISNNPIIHDGYSGQASFIGAGVANTVGGNLSGVGSGQSNSIAADNSSIVGGNTNTINLPSSSPSDGSGPSEFIGGGFGNVLDDNFGVIVGGKANTVTADFSAILSGSSNSIVAGTVNAPGNGNSAVVAGTNNQINGTQSAINGSFIGAGTSNQITATLSFLGAGQSNSENGTYNFIGAGMGNNATGTSASVVGGEGNYVSGGFNIIGGGSNNFVSGQYSVIAGGQGNNASGSYAMIGAGASNQAISANSTVGGGSSNSAAGVNATIGGGSTNSAVGIDGTVGGGFTNNAGGQYSTVAGGYENFAVGTVATVGGGFANSASGQNATIPGGGSNVAGGRDSFAAGHGSHAINDGTFVWSDYSTNPKTLSSSASNQFLVRAAGGVFLYSSAKLTSGVRLAPGSGSWSTLSDRASKVGIERVSGSWILSKVESLPISEWSYSSQGLTIRHVGPMAQDFREAFGLGEDDKHISSVDEEGVALVAIQALHAEITARDRRISSLSDKYSRLEARLESLERASKTSIDKHR